MAEKNGTAGGRKAAGNAAAGSEPGTQSATVRSFPDRAADGYGDPGSTANRNSFPNPGYAISHLLYASAGFATIGTFDRYTRPAGAGQDSPR